MTVGGLFSGIGGWELGLERAGMDIAWHCEADPFCRRVLDRHWPGVPTFEDVKTLTAGMAEGVDVLCGGFPCQDLSVGGKQAGIDASRSGLWAEMFRLACEFRPRYVLIENVSNLLYGSGGDWMRRVLGDLTAGGFDAEWDCLPASSFGAPHRRDRIWIVAYPNGDGLREQSGWQRGASGQGPRVLADDGSQGSATDSSRAGLEGRLSAEASREAFRIAATGRGGCWEHGTAPSGVRGVGYGLPDWVDRIHGLGNALVPQIAEWIGRRVLAYELEMERR